MAVPAEIIDLITPIALALAAVLALIVIFGLLRRSLRIEGLGPAYMIATGLLGAALLLDGEGLLPPGWARAALLTSLVALWGYVLLDLLEDLLIERALRRRGVAVPRLARDIFRAVTLAALALIAVNRFFGISLNSLLISSTVVSAVVGLALQDLLKDVVAGIALQVERPFVPGDWIEFDTQIARIVELNWRATRAVSVDNTHLIVPNATLAQAQITNYTIISPIQALHVQIVLSPEHPPNTVKEVLVAAARAAEGVLSDPPPGVRLIAYGEYSLTYDIKFWMRGFERYVETRDAVMTSAWYHTRRAGFRLPTPMRELYMHEADPALQSEEQLRQLRESADALARVDLFGGLSDDERADLAGRAGRRIFGRGEVLVRQGDQDDTLYIVRRGRVRVEVARAAGEAPLRVGELGAGDFFGELAMLTGAPRYASVVAEQDTEALLIRRDALGPLIGRNPSIAEGLSAILERRLAQSRSALDSLPGADGDDGLDMSQPGLLRRISSLFGVADPRARRG
jgi:small-conductance mechanosensitive channel/CRP-like cAMP-binding protein